MTGKSVEGWGTKVDEEAMFTIEDEGISLEDEATTELDWLSTFNEVEDDWTMVVVGSSASRTLEGSTMGADEDSGMGAEEDSGMGATDEVVTFWA